MEFGLNEIMLIAILITLLLIWLEQNKYMKYPPQWEYELIDQEDDYDLKLKLELLNSTGENNWELVSVAKRKYPYKEGREYNQYFFKRIKR